MKGDMNMTEVEGEYFLTIFATADEVYHISNTSLRKVDILNDTQDALYVSDSPDFTATDVVAPYITIPEGVAANGIYTPSVGIYVKAAADGDIVIMGAA